MKKYTSRQSTVIITDLRRFTKNFEHYQKIKSEKFLAFVDEYYCISLKLIDLVCGQREYYLNNSGDGVLVILFGKNHEKRGYLLCLLMNQIFQQLCDEFNREEGTNISFGIGIESGTVRKIDCTASKDKFQTYLGSVINIAARIESKTKRFHRTNVITGAQLYHRLIKILYKDQYSHILKNSSRLRNSYKGIVRHHNELNRLSQNLMLFYIFEHAITGVDEPIPLYRLSPTLADIKKESFFKIVKKLSESPDQFQIIKTILNQS